jgi:hypothetical protein
MLEWHRSYTTVAWTQCLMGYQVTQADHYPPGDDRSIYELEGRILYSAYSLIGCSYSDG